MQLTGGMVPCKRLARKRSGRPAARTWLRWSSRFRDNASGGLAALMGWRWWPTLRPAPQNGNGAFSLIVLSAKKVRICRTPGNAINVLLCKSLKFFMSATRILSR